MHSVNAVTVVIQHQAALSWHFVTTVLPSVSDREKLEGEPIYTDTTEDDGSNCLYGRSTTDLIQLNNDNLTFTVGETFPGGVPNPVIAFGQIWPVSKHLSICCIHMHIRSYTGIA